MKAKKVYTKITYLVTFDKKKLDFNTKSRTRALAEGRKRLKDGSTKTVIIHTISKIESFEND